MIDDFNDMLRLERVEENFCAARADRRIDFRRVPCRSTDQDEICRCAFLEKFPDIFRDARRIFIIVSRFEMNPLVFEHLEELIQHHRIEFADFINEKDAAMRIRHKAGLWFRDAFIRQIPLRALIDRIMDRTDQWFVMSRLSQRSVVPSHSTNGAFSPKAVKGSFFASSRTSLAAVVLPTPGGP